VTAELLVRPFAETDVREAARRALLRRFPYAIYFVAGEELIAVIAVLHQHRRPEAWRARV